MTQTEELQLLRKEMRPLRQRVAQLENAWQSQRERAERIEEENKDLRKENKQLKEENKQLKENLGKIENHRDVLAGMIFKPNIRPKQQGEKKRGAQCGHLGCSRKKPKQIDQEKNVYLTRCPDCGTQVKQSQITYQRIVEDIPLPKKTIITKYHIQRQWCSRCQKEIYALPQNTLEGFRFGLNTLILILFLKYRMRTPLAKIREMFKEQYRLKITEGGIQTILHKLKKRFGPKYQKILNEIRKSGCKHADETGWRIEGQNSWLWLFASPKAAYYTQEETRGKGVAEEVLGQNPKGVLVRDDYRAYQNLPLKQQSCWAHLLRVAKEIAEKENASKKTKSFHRELQEIFQELKTLINQPFQKRKREQSSKIYLAKLQALANQPTRSKDVKGVQTRIRNQHQNLLTALLYEGVPLTNNYAERQLRPLVIQRKISGGSRSPKGATTHAVNMSIIQTLFLKGKPFFDSVKKLLTPPTHKHVLEKGE